MPRYLRFGWVVGHLLVLLAVLVCLRLAWWQLERSESDSGTIQNVGYALLWPAFGVSFVYMWIKFLRLETERSAAEDEEHAASVDLMLAEAEALTAGAVPAVSSDTRHPEFTDTSGSMDGAATDRADFVGVVGDEDADDPELIAYNRALAALADKDRHA